MVDMFEQEGALFVEVDLPGVRREHVGVETQGSQLVIWAERPSEEPARRYRLRGRRTSREYTHDLSLPPEARADDATAHLDRGVLQVRIPLSDAADPRRSCAIQVGG